MAARLLKLPRSYYKRRTPPPAFRTTSRTFHATLAADLGSIGPNRNRGISSLRKMLMQDLASDIVNKSRALHINYTVDMWKELRADGHLNGEVAVVVDGSPQRPIKNVQFAGVIQVLSPASLQVMLEATALAYATLVRAASRRPYGVGYEQKKNNSYSYRRSFEIYVSDKTLIKSPTDLARMGEAGTFTEKDWISIQNWVPYAAKLERDPSYQPGPFIQAFKAVRSKYGNQVAVRFDYVQGSTIMKQSGTPTPQPVIRIGQPGAFPSRAVNIGVLRRRNQKRGKPY